MGGSGHGTPGRKPDKGGGGGEAGGVGTREGKVVGGGTESPLSNSEMEAEVKSRMELKA